MTREQVITAIARRRVKELEKCRAEIAFVYAVITSLPPDDELQRRLKALLLQSLERTRCQDDDLLAWGDAHMTRCLRPRASGCAERFGGRESVPNGRKHR